MSLKIIFAGTPEFALPSLQALLDSEHAVLAVYTQPDRPAGRGQQLHASPIKMLAEAHNIPIFQPKTLRNEHTQNELKKMQPDVMVVVAYGLILPQAILTIPKFGCINVHPSLLPRWRGAAPIQRSIEAGDSESGVTIMQMDHGMDTGPILKQEKYHLKSNETSAQLHTVFSVMGARLLLTVLNELNESAHVSEHVFQSIAQDNSKAIYAAKIDKAEAIINWHESAITIQNKIRAFNPWPVANTVLNNYALKIWEALAISEKTSAMPGTIIRIEKDAFFVATGSGVLKILSVQLPGKKQMSAKDFLQGHGKYLC